MGYMTVYLNAYYCMLFISRVRGTFTVGIRFSGWLVSGYAHVFILLSVVIVILCMSKGCVDSLGSHQRNLNCSLKAKNITGEKYEQKRIENTWSGATLVLLPL